MTSDEMMTRGIDSLEWDNIPGISFEYHSRKALHHYSGWLWASVFLCSFFALSQLVFFNKPIAFAMIEIGGSIVILVIAYVVIWQHNYRIEKLKRDLLNRGGVELIGKMHGSLIADPKPGTLHLWNESYMVMEFTDEQDRVMFVLSH